MDLWSLVFGFSLGLVVAVVFVAIKLSAQKRQALRIPNVPKSTVSALVAVFIVGGLLLAQIEPSFAQTPVPLEIPTNEIFIETNNWMATFAPVAAIGIGISIALAVLAYLGNMIKSAFK